jgi:hypothetical protein
LPQVLMPSALYGVAGQKNYRTIRDNYRTIPAVIFEQTVEMAVPRLSVWHRCFFSIAMFTDPASALENRRPVVLYLAL